MLNLNSAPPPAWRIQRPPGKSLRTLSSPFFFFKICIRVWIFFLKKLYFFKKNLFPFMFSYISPIHHFTFWLIPPIPVREACLKLCASQFFHNFFLSFSNFRSQNYASIDYVLFDPNSWIYDQPSRNAALWNLLPNLILIISHTYDLLIPLPPYHSSSPSQHPFYLHPSP